MRVNILIPIKILIVGVIHWEVKQMKAFGNLKILMWSIGAGPGRTHKKSLLHLYIAPLNRSGKEYVGHFIGSQN